MKDSAKVKFFPGIFVHIHENDCLDEEGIALKNVWDKCKKSRKFCSLLVWEMFEPYESKTKEKTFSDLKLTLLLFQGN